MKWVENARCDLLSSPGEPKRHHSMVGQVGGADADTEGRGLYQRSNDAGLLPISFRDRSPVFDVSAKTA